MSAPAPVVNIDMFNFEIVVFVREYLAQLNIPIPGTVGKKSKETFTQVAMFYLHIKCKIISNELVIY